MAIKTKRFIASRKSCSCSMPGVWRAVAYCTGCVVVFHSPRACAHVARTMDINAHYRTMSDGRQENLGSVPLLSSQLEEKHSIFGGADRLTECVAFAINQYHPQCLVLANSCVAGVIGDDVEAVARATEAQYGIPVLTVDCCGFLDGEYYQGYFEITEQLVDRFMQPAPKIPGTVVLLGDNGGPWGHYATEVTRLLNEMKLKVIGQFPGYMTFEDLSQIGTAEAAIILGGRGQVHQGLQKVAAKLQAKLGINYVNVYPVGWANTKAWLRDIGRLMHREEGVEQVLEHEVYRLQKALDAMRHVTFGKKTVLCLGRQLLYYHPGAVLESIELLGLNLQGIVLLDAYQAKDREEMRQVVASLTKVPIYNAQEGEVLLTQSDLVLTTHELQNKKIKQLFLPMLPKVGTMGELEFLQAITRLLQSRIKGGVTYV